MTDPERRGINGIRQGRNIWAGRRSRGVDVPAADGQCAVCAASVNVKTLPGNSRDERIGNGLVVHFPGAGRINRNRRDDRLGYGVAECIECRTQCIDRVAIAALRDLNGRAGTQFVKLYSVRVGVLGSNDGVASGRQVSCCWIPFQVRAGPDGGIDIGQCGSARIVGPGIGFFSNELVLDRGILGCSRTGGLSDVVQCQSGGRGACTDQCFRIKRQGNAGLIDVKA